jgi:hypothetical protein
MQASGRCLINATTRNPDQREEDAHLGDFIEDKNADAGEARLFLRGASRPAAALQRGAPLSRGIGGRATGGRNLENMPGSVSLTATSAALTGLLKVVMERKRGGGA